MTERTWTFVNRDGWPSGGWDSEPDKVQWIDSATGLDCLIHRNPSGALCGYVGVPPGHPYHGKHYQDIAYWDEEADRPAGPRPHGGLTFAEGCGESDESTGRGICHIPEPGRPADVWWLGFDCAHCDDLVPGEAFRYTRAGIYRDMAYVKQEVAGLAADVAKAA